MNQQSLNFKKCDSWTDGLTDITKSRDAVASKKSKNTCEKHIYKSGIASWTK